MLARLRVAFFFLVVSFGLLQGCTGCSESSEDVPSMNHGSAEQSTQASGSPCYNRCTLGEFACDDVGRVVRCTVEGDDCPAFNEVIQEECESDLMCYQGACIEPPEVSLPAEPEEGRTSILDVGTVSYPLPSMGELEVVIIPHDAFMAAIRGRFFDELPAIGSSSSVPDTNENDVHDLIDLGIETIIDANDVNVIGGYADFDDSEQYFEGDIFLVPMDPVFTEDVALNPAGTTSLNKVEFQRYNVYIAKGLSGYTSYRMYNASFVGVDALGLPSGSCCNSPGGERSCNFVDPSQSPFGGANPCQFGDWGDCPPTPIDAWEQLDALEAPYGLFPSNPLAQPFRMGFGSTTEPDPDRLTREILKRGNGLPATILYTFQHRSRHDSSKWNSGTTHPPEHNYPHNIAGLSYLDLNAISRSPVGAVCEQCTKSLCPAIGPAIRETPFEGGISSECGSVTKTEVPLICQQIGSSGMNMPSECAGSCLGCFGGEDHNANPAGISPGFCHHTVGGGTMYSELPGGASGGSGAGCPAPGTPSYCQFVTPVEGGACACGDECQQRQAEMWSELVGCGANGVSSSPGYSCCGAGETCVCREGEGGQWCTVCNENGDCYEVVQDDLVDGDVAADTAFTDLETGQTTYYDCEHNEQTMEKECEVQKQLYSDFEPIVYNVQPAEMDDGKAKTDKTKKATTEHPNASSSTPAESEPNAAVDEKVEKVKAKDPESSVAAVDENLERSKKDEGPEDAGTGGSATTKATDKLEKAEKTTAVDVEKAPLQEQDGVDEKGAGKVAQGEEGDPVLVASGDFLLQHKDLSFPGPARPLEFSRQYLAQSSDRSVLGSNWTHNYDVRVLPIKEGNAADWMPHYCKDNSPYTTCALVKRGNGPARLFMLDPASTDLQGKLMFMPQAGTTDTLYFEGGQWILRQADGHLYLFNEFGYLIEDRDRFGNGFEIEYDPTPMFALYKRWCDATSEEAKIYQAQINNFDWRFCQIAGWLFGDKSLPQVSETGFEPEITDPQTGNSRPTISFPLENPLGMFINREADPSIDDPASGQGISAAARMICQKSGREDGESINSCIIRVTMAMAIDMAVARSFMRDSVLSKLQTGDRKMRPTLVRDDLGRTLNFTYYTNAIEKETYGLLETVSGPGGASVTFEYDRPTHPEFPARLNESFLTKVTRQDSANNIRNTQNGSLKTIEMVYNWPSASNFRSFDAHFTEGDRNGSILDSLISDYHGFYGTYTGCTLNPNGAAVVCRNGSGISQVCSDEGNLLYMANGMPQPEGAGCSVAGSARRPGNPPQLALFQAHEWISQVADNIVQVKYNGVIESETVYEIDPYQFDFDRVEVQRYGGLSLADHDPSVSNPHNHGGQPWLSDLPEFQFFYLKARVHETDKVPSDPPTDTTEYSRLLPSELADRYPVEELPPEFSWDAYDRCLLDEESCEDWVPEGGNAPENPDTEGLTHNVGTCLLNTRTIKKKSLPQWHPELPYYRFDEPTEGSDLRRSRLTCEHLAEIHGGDATHNGLLHKPELFGEGELRWKLIEGDRRSLEADLKRICAWTMVVDRDGRERVYGLNFKGLTLVEAIHEPGSVGGEYLISETLYNADGNILEQREPTRGSAAWEPEDGYVQLNYDEFLQPEGPSDWEAWLPFWWTRRDNITSIERFPNQNNGGVTYAHEWDGVSLSGESILSTRIDMSYEPLFNQLSESTFGVVTSEGGSTYKGQTKVFYDFDYQEFDRDSDDFCAAMSAFTRWGYNPMYRVGDVGGGELGIIIACEEDVTAWQFPQTFFAQNLNGDVLSGVGGGSDIIGTPNFSGNASASVKGVPVRITSRDLRTGQEQQTLISYSSTGRPAHIQYPSGAMTDYRYYKLDQDNSLPDDEKYGALYPGESAQASPFYRGMLAQVIHKRFDDEYPTELGPDASTGHTRCDALAGPYQWMLPGGCQDAADAQVKLTQMGIPAEVQTLVFKLVDREEDVHWSAQTYSYAQTGHVVRVWSDGLTSSMHRDVDGRVMSSTDAVGNVTSYTRDHNGRVKQVLVQDTFLTQLSKVRYEYDNEGRLLTKCVEVNPGGCTNVLTLSSFPFDPASDTPVDHYSMRAGIDQNPDYLLTTHRYTPEGHLYSTIGPDGVETRTYRNKRGLPTSVIVAPSVNAGAAAGDARTITHSYDDRGNLESTTYASDAAGTPAFTEEYSYDGFHRMRRVTDTRGTTWHVAFDARGRTSAIKQDTRHAGYSTAHSVDPNRWERFIEYGTTVDANGLHHISVTQGPITSTYHMDAAGRTIFKEGTGSSRQWFAYDNTGRAVWSMDETGAQAMNFAQPDVDPSEAEPELQLPRSYSVRVSTDSQDGSYRTETNISAFDQGGRITQNTRIGAGQVGPELRQTTTFVTDALGRVVGRVNPEGVSTTTTRNLLGWPTQVTRAGPNGGYDTTQHIHNVRGQIAQTIDPRGESTTWDYAWDGQKLARTLSTSSTAHESYAYDGLGRLQQLIKKPGQPGSETLGYEYDSRGDLTRVTTTRAGAQADYVRRAYDDLGRVTDAWNYNPNSVGETHPVAHTRYIRDGIGRLVEEQTSLENTSGAPAHQHSVTYEHNLVQGSGGLDTWETQVTYPSGKTVTRVSDRVGRLSLLTVGNSPTSITSSVDMHWLGGLSKGRSHDYGGTDPLVESRLFDGLGRLSSLTYSAVDLDPMTGQPNSPSWGQDYCEGAWEVGCAAPVWGVDLKYDVMSRVTASRKQFAHPLRDQQEVLIAPDAHRRLYRGYEYNDRGHLTGEWHKLQAAHSEFDSLTNHQVTDAQLATIGGENWLWQREANVGSLKAVVDANTNASRWRHVDSSGNLSDRLTGYRLDAVEVDGQTGTITHDIHNRITEDLDHSYTFDAMNRLVEVRTSAGSLLESYLYDASGRMVLRTSGADKELYVHDGLQMVAAYDYAAPASALTWEAVWGAGLDQLLEFERAGTTHVAMRDERNSIVGLWDSNQRELSAMAEYDAFGRTRLLTNNESISCEEEGSGSTCMMLAGDMPFGFNSAWRSPATGLVLMRNRWYSPKLGQFISLDPLGTIDSHNMYAFAAFDPINGWDPMGLKEKEFVQKGGAAPVTPPPNPVMPPPPGAYPGQGPNPYTGPAPQSTPNPAPRAPGPGPGAGPGPSAGPGVGGIAARVLGVVTSPVAVGIFVGIATVFYPKPTGNSELPRAYRERMARQRLAQQRAAGTRTSSTPGLDKQPRDRDDDDDDDERHNVVVFAVNERLDEFTDFIRVTEGVPAFNYTDRYPSIDGTDEAPIIASRILGLMEDADEIHIRVDELVDSHSHLEDLLDDGYAHDNGNEMPPEHWTSFEFYHVYYNYSENSKIWYRGQKYDVDDIEDVFEMSQE